MNEIKNNKEKKKISDYEKRIEQLYDMVISQQEQQISPTGDFVPQNTANFPDGGLKLKKSQKRIQEIQER